MTDLFAEVDEALRQERVAKLWQEYGRYLIGFIATLILLTALISAYKSWEPAYTNAANQPNHRSD